jgi:hypothetical protein
LTDFNDWYVGRISVNGEEHRLTRQANSRLGVTLSLPVSRRQSLKISYSDGIAARVGGKFRTLSVGWQATACERSARPRASTSVRWRQSNLQRDIQCVGIS